MKRQEGSVMAMAFALVLALTGALAELAEAAQSRPIKLVVLGDSLVAGYNLPQSAAFPAVLERALRARGHAVEVVNAGVSGDTASAGLERVDWSVPDDTDGVILELGANDMLRGLDPAIPRKALESIVERLQQRQIPVMLAGMRAAPNLGPDYAGRFDPIYRSIAERHDLVLYPFFLEGVAGDRSLNLPDGIHPNAAGVERIVERIVPQVEAFLARIAEKR